MYIYVYIYVYICTYTDTRLKLACTLVGGVDSGVTSSYVYVSHHHIYRLKLACTLVKLCVSRPTLRAPAGRLPTYVARPLAYGTILILTEQY